MGASWKRVLLAVVVAALIGAGFMSEMRAITATASVLGFFGLIASTLMTPGHIHGDIEPRWWTIGLAVNASTYYGLLSAFAKVRSRGTENHA